MKKITFLRHAQIETLLDGSKNMLKDNLNLSRHGIAQANIIGQELRTSDFDIVVVADSIRTRKTAEIINGYLKKPLEIEPSFNAWKASKVANFISFDDYWKAYSEFVACNGVATNSTWETFEELKTRTLNGIQKYEKYDSILVVSHSIIISLYTGISRSGIKHCLPKTIDWRDLKCSPPDFVSVLN